jgi:hypothetical protein
VKPLSLVPVLALGVAMTLAGEPSRASAAAPDPIIIGPYLQHLSSTGVDVKVELSVSAEASIEITGPGPKRTITSPSSTFHSLHLGDLTPETHYRYSVHVGAFTAPAGQFVTAPPDDSRGPFAFLLYGDTRTDDQTHAAVVRAMQAQSFDFLVNTGDYVAAGGDSALWRGFFAVEADLLRDHCVFGCVGNHELAGDQAATNYLGYFGPTGAPVSSPYGSSRWGRARLFLLNAFQDWGQGELAWLRSELAKADSEPNLTWRIVVLHWSPWSSGHHGDDTRMLMAGVPELLVQHHVDVVLAGHDHIYERGERNGLKYVVSGGAGAPLYPDIAPKPSTRRAEATYHFVRFAVDGDVMHLEAKRLDGSTIENCGFRHGESWDCDAKASPQVATPTPFAQSAPEPAPSEPRATPSRCACTVPGIHGDSANAVGPLMLAAGALFSRRARRRRRSSPLVERLRA